MKIKKGLKKLIKVLFILSVIGMFVGLTVLLIIIAQGGQVTPQGIEKTGNIRLYVEPSRDINVFVNGEKVRLNDKRIENLKKGEYEIIIEKEGYSPWAKTVVVEEGIVKELYATLFPAELQLEQITTTDIDQAFFSQDGNFVVYVVKNAAVEENGIWKLKLTQNTLSFVNNRPDKIYEIDERLATLLDEDYTIDISLNNTKFVLSTPTAQWIYSMDKGTQPINMLAIERVGFMAEQYTWFEEGDSLILEKDKTIYEYEIAENIAKIIYQFTNTEPIYAVNGRSLIFYANNLYYKYQNSQKELLQTNVKSILPKAEKLWLSSHDDNLLYVQSNSELYFIDLKRSIHKIGAYELLELAPGGRGALLLDPATNIISLFGNEFIPAKNQIDTNIIILNENFDSTEQSYKWASDSSHVIYREDNKIYLIDLYGANSYKILESQQLDKPSYQLIKEASEFIVLLSDSMKDDSSNLHKIALRK